MSLSGHMERYVIVVVRKIVHCTRDSYNVVCPHVRGDNQRAIASGLSYVHVDRHGIIIISPPSV